MATPAPTWPAHDLPSQPSGSGGAATTVAPYRAATSAVPSDEWSSTTITS